MSRAAYVSELLETSRAYDRKRDAALAAKPETAALMAAVDGMTHALLGAGVPVHDERVGKLCGFALRCEHAIAGPNEIGEESQREMLAYLWKLAGHEGASNGNR